jgi:hypothetical protein
MDIERKFYEFSCYIEPIQDSHIFISFIFFIYFIIIFSVITTYHFNNKSKLNKESISEECVISDTESDTELKFELDTESDTELKFELDIELESDTELESDIEWKPKKIRRKYDRDISIFEHGQLIRHIYKYDIWYAKYDKYSNLFLMRDGECFSSPSRFAQTHATRINRKKTTVSGWDKCECLYQNRWITLHQYWKLFQ